MSATNGHVPEGATIATLEMLRAANTAYRKLPRLSEHLGQDVVVKIRAIRAATYIGFLPPQPDAAKDWPRDEQAREAVAQAWFDALPEAEKEKRRATLSDLACKVISAGLINPAVSAEGALDFGPDIDWLAQEILVFSGLLKAEPAEAAAA